MGRSGQFSGVFWQSIFRACVQQYYYFELPAAAIHLSCADYSGVDVERGAGNVVQKNGADHYIPSAFYIYGGYLWYDCRLYFQPRYYHATIEFPYGRRPWELAVQCEYVPSYLCYFRGLAENWMG